MHSPPSFSTASTKFLLRSGTLSPVLIIRFCATIFCLDWKQLDAQQQKPDGSRAI
jgi:hypothetical protein